ncbi:uncharacterized protein EI90DRAFT_3127156 [Cantharellus anzutake]|uniref:uncharacterized protein n=1 Tax=Cantharellus anzutake TaxID=1750568 RepID=UPI001903BB99|nr:uncharacterized protein EI90DRAFT_3127156 [Cantharellus anzutake]KAF8327472.1 hypothetical protein EI90DRAFT_3127156 [Cantharellus anzutake]
MSFYENLVGGYFSGLVLEAILLGVVTVQTFLYYQRFSRDHIALKFSVGFLWLSQAFEGRFDDSDLQSHSLQRSDLSFKMVRYCVPDLCGEIMFPLNKGQGWPTYPPSFILGYFFYLCPILFCLSTLSIQWIDLVTNTTRPSDFGASGDWTCDLYRIKYYPRYPKHDPSRTPDYNKLADTRGRFSALTQELNSHEHNIKPQAAADLIIAVSMSYYLQRCRTGFRQTDTVLRKLTLYAINTGLVTSVLALAVMFAFAFYGFHFIAMILILPLGGVYNASFLANLHSRSRLRKELYSGGERGISIHISRIPHRVQNKINAVAQRIEGHHSDERTDPTSSTGATLSRPPPAGNQATRSYPLSTL